MPPGPAPRGPALLLLLGAAASQAVDMQCLPFDLPSQHEYYYDDHHHGEPTESRLCSNKTDACVCDTKVNATTGHVDHIGHCSMCVHASCIGQTDKMADASGIKLTQDRVREVSVMQPSRVDLGDPAGCIGNPPSSKVHWCLWLQHGFGQSIAGGVCLPATCSASDQGKLRKVLGELYMNKLRHMHRWDPERTDTNYAMRALAWGGRIHCATGPMQGTLDKDFSSDHHAVTLAVFLITLGAFGLLCMFAVEGRRRCVARKAEEEPLLPEAKKKEDPAASAVLLPDPWSPGDDAEARGDGAADAAADADAAAPGCYASLLRPVLRKACAVCLAFASCFDARAHYYALLHCAPRRPTSFLHGFRCWSIAWVVMGHIADFPNVPGFDNPSYMETEISLKFRFVLAYAYTAVDTFFYMSGFLSCYLLVARWPKATFSVRKEDLPRSLFAALKQLWRLLFIYVDRYMRLTPMYGLCILVSIHLLQYVSVGPLNILGEHGQPIGDCRKMWWRNLLYINTLGKNYEKDMCFGHSWYLGDDMVFVWCLTPLMVLFVYLPRTAVVATVASMCLTLWYAVKWGDTAPGGGVYYSEDGMKSYYQPWGRAAPYIWGILAAFALRHDWTKRRIRDAVAHPAVRLAVYVVAGGLLGGLLVWQWWTERSDPQTADAAVSEDMYKIVAEASPALTPKAWRAKHFGYYFGWGLGLLLLTLVWANGHGGPVTAFLSHPVHEVLGRLTYGVYLLHPMILLVLKLSLSGHSIPHYTDYWMLSIWTSACIGTFIAAGLFNVFAERPVAALWDLATSKSERNRGK